MDLIFPDAAQLEPLDQCAGLLLLGQGFASNAEFLALARRTAAKLIEVAPFKTLVDSNEGKLAILADATIGIDLGVTAAAPEAPRALGIGTGSQLEQALGGLFLPAWAGIPAGTAKISQFWGLTHVGGSMTKLVVIIRKPPTGATPGEYYSLPVVVVDVDSGREWWLLILRALSQSLAGLADEFTRDGTEWAAPPAEWITNNLDPTLPPWPHRLGRNTIIFNTAQDARLGKAPMWVIFPGRDTAWWDRGWPRGNTPYRADPKATVIGDSPKATIRLAQGASGFRTGVLRCDQPCVMQQVPAEPDGTLTRAHGDRVGTQSVLLCPVCLALVARSLGTSWKTEGTATHIDRQVSHYDLAHFRSRIPVAVTPTTTVTVTETMSKGIKWKFNVGVESTGLVIRDLRLINRPGDPMADSENVAEAISFSDLSYESGAGLQTLSIDKALANTNQPPVLEIGRNTSGMLRGGTRLTLHWEPEDGLLIRADLSLVCRDIAFDFDPGGAAEACKFYPELVLTWIRRDRDVPKIRRLHGCVTITANNRITGTQHGHHGMVHNSQLAMLIADSNISKTDAEYVGDIGLGQFRWKSGRLLGALDRAVGKVAYDRWLAGWPLLPEWSWLFDYGRAVTVGLPEVLEVVCWEQSDVERGAPRSPSNPRQATVPWPPHPDPGLLFPPGAPPGITVRKMPRQGAYDSIHLNADMGVEAGRPVVAAPFCADLCLHLHVRWGTHAVAAGKDHPPFLGWSSGAHAYSHSTLGAPLVPPNQRISLGVTRPDATKTKIRYIADIHEPKEGKRQVVLEQGLGFAYTYGGLGLDDRFLISGVYGGSQDPAIVLGFVAGVPDSAVRAFFRGIYTQIRFSSYGSTAAVKPQQIPTDVFTDPNSVQDPLIFRKLVDL